MAEVVFLVDDVIHIVPVIDDRVDEAPLGQPLALLTARVVAEKFDDIFMLEVGGLEAQNPLNIRADQRLVNRVESVLGRRQASRFVNGDAANVLALELRVFGGEHKAEIFPVDRILDRIREAGDFFGHGRHGAQAVVARFDVEAHARKLLARVLERFPQVFRTLISGHNPGGDVRRPHINALDPQLPGCLPSPGRAGPLRLRFEPCGCR